MFGVQTGPPRITTPELAGRELGQELGSSGAVGDFVKAIENAQQAWFEKNNIGAKGLPKDVQTVVDNKVSYIQSMMAAALKARASAGIYNEISYEVSARGTMTFNQAWMNEKILGSFVQDIMIFGGVPGGMPKGAETAALPDVEAIMTELKESFSPETLHSGMLTAGISIKGAGKDTTEEEKYAASILRTEANKEAIAIIQLYNKMRNFLLLLTETPSHPGRTWGSKTKTRVHFIAIVLFVELIIKEVRKWVEKGLSVQRGERPIGAYVKVTTPQKIAKHTKGDEIIFTQQYHITFENLYANPPYNKEAKGGINQLLKNLESLYLKRVNLLDFITGPGKGKEAARFFSAIKNMEIPAFGTENLNLPNFA